VSNEQRLSGDGQVRDPGLAPSLKNTGIGHAMRRDRGLTGREPAARLTPDFHLSIRRDPERAGNQPEVVRSRRCRGRNDSEGREGQASPDMAEMKSGIHEFSSLQGDAAHTMGFRAAFRLRYTGERNCASANPRPDFISRKNAEARQG
jgi:hypothetical protein